MKKILMAMLVLVLSFSLISCGESKKEETKEAKEDTGKQQEATDEKNRDDIESTLKSCITTYEMDYDVLIPDGGSDIRIGWNSEGAEGENAPKEFIKIVNEAIDSLKTTDSNGNYPSATIKRNSDGTYSINVTHDK